MMGDVVAIGSVILPAGAYPSPGTSHITIESHIEQIISIAEVAGFIGVLCVGVKVANISRGR
jgi:hypothetical protein